MALTTQGMARDLGKVLSIYSQMKYRWVQRIPWGQLSGKTKSAVSIVAQALEKLKEGKIALGSAWLFVKHATMAQKVYKKIWITLEGEGGIVWRTKT